MNRKRREYLLGNSKDPMKKGNMYPLYSVIGNRYYDLNNALIIYSRTAKNIAVECDKAERDVADNNTPENRKVLSLLHQLSVAVDSKHRAEIFLLMSDTMQDDLNKNNLYLIDDVNNIIGDEIVLP